MNVALEIFVGHGKEAAEKVAEVVGQVGIDATDQGVFREIAVKPECYLPEQEIPECIRAVFIGHFVGVHDIPQGLRHLGATDRPPSVSEYIFRKRHAQGHKHR